MVSVAHETRCLAAMFQGASEALAIMCITPKKRAPNPVDAVRDLVVAAGREVDEESFRAAAAYCNEPVGEEVRKVKNGDHVIFKDEHGVEHDALLTFPHIGGDGEPSVNLVYVLKDPTMQDTYGQQIGRETSVVHQSNQAAQGFYWRRP